jgi:hypothetical protein
MKFNEDTDSATLLRGLSLDDVYALASGKLEVAEKEIRSQYAHLNFGMQRMSVGNRLRKAAKEAAAK